VLGWVEPDDVPALINAATIVVIPSRNEGLPNVAKEAGLMARPVVATRVGGLPEIVRHSETGLLVEAEDSAALTEAIVFLLDHREEATEMGQRARVSIAEVFGFETYVSAFDTLYARLAK
jgi:glycogen(starch) synthase